MMLISAAKTALTSYGFDTTQDPMNAWLDQAKNELEETYDWPFLQAVATISGVAGSNTITLPADFFKIQSLRDMTRRGSKLRYKDINGFERDIDDPTTQGQPQYYTVIGEDTIQLYPVPDTAITWRVVYQINLPDINNLADNDPLPGPSRFHYLYVIGAAYIGLQADNEEDRSGNAQSMFNQGVSRLIRKYKAVIGDSETVQNVQGY